MSASALPPDAKRELDAWRAEKDREMRAPSSPLAFVGQRVVGPGVSTLGSGADDGLRFERPGIPEHVLELTVRDVRLFLKPLQPLVTLNGEPTQGILVRPGDKIGVGPLQLEYQGASTAGARFTITDQARPERLSFAGLHYLPVDAHYRVPATFEVAPAGKTLVLETTQHQKKNLPYKGTLRFELGGAPQALEAFSLGERPNDYFVIFRDTTNGTQTYGAGRFLWVKGAIDGKTIVDFNQAWNPLCAYSDGYNCPLAPPDNRMTIPIPVGEAPYGSH